MTLFLVAEGGREIGVVGLREDYWGDLHMLAGWSCGLRGAHVRAGSGLR
jgi:hypothetical protein